MVSKMEERARQNRKLHIYLHASGEYNDLFVAALRPTLTEYDLDNEVSLLHIDSPFQETLVGRTSWARYKELMRRRIGVYVEIVKANIGNKILFLDCDVIMIQNCKQELLDILDDCDMCFQSPGFNAGIWGVRCSSTTAEFFQSFYDHISAVKPEDRPDGYPQFELKDMVITWQKQKKIKVTELPREYGFLCDDTKIYHAVNGGHSVLAKITSLALGWETIHTMKGLTLPSPLIQVIPWFIPNYIKYIEQLPPDAPPQNISFHGFLNTTDSLTLESKIQAGDYTALGPIEGYNFVTQDSTVLQILTNRGYVIALVGDNSADKYWPVTFTAATANYFLQDDLSRIRHEIDTGKK